MRESKRERHENGMSRRDFVRASTAVLAAGPIVTASRASGGPRALDPIRVGLIGCGGRGTGAATQALDADSGVQIVALADVFTDRIDEALKNLTNHAPERVRVPPERRFSGFDGWQRLLAGEVDVVILATPPQFRPAHLKAAIESGRHVFTEKPMAVDAPGVRSVLETAKKAAEKNLSLMSGFCWRYSYPERATFERVLDGAIGDVVSMHTTYHTGILGQQPRRPEWSDMEFQLRNWWHFNWLSGDHIVEQACHAVDWINWAMGGVMPVKATALGGRQARQGAESGNVYDHFAVIYEYAGGARCFHTCRQIPSCSNDNTAFIMGTKGTCTILPWDSTPRGHVITGTNAWRYEGERPNMYQVEHDELFAAIRSGRPVNDGVYMANSTMMSILGRMAAYTGQTITWDDAMKSKEDLTPPSYAFGPVPVAPVPVPGETKFV